MTQPSDHVIDLLSDLIDERLTHDDAERVRAHLGQCLECRRAYDLLRDAIQEIRDLPVFAPPAGVWQAVERQLDDTGSARAAADIRPPTLRRRLAAALIAASIVGIVVSYGLGLTRASWSIERLAGAPTAGSRAIVRSGHLTEGEWLETDVSSRARLSIGTLGSADVGPGSRVKLVQAGGIERALRVERGTIDARVWAPPRFFLVETPAATAIDLGCVYTLQVDSRGNGTLLVRSGQVELRGSGRVSLIVAGTAAQMRAGVGPGTPYSDRESQSFRDALTVVDFGGGTRTEALDQLLAASTVASTITLWHLFPRVDGAERMRVYDRLAALAAPPTGVTRQAVVALDARALDRWRDTLEPTWSTERVRLWKRAWRAVWSRVGTR